MSQYPYNTGRYSPPRFDRPPFPPGINTSGPGPAQAPPPGAFPPFAPGGYGAPPSAGPHSHNHNQGHGHHQHPHQHNHHAQHTPTSAPPAYRPFDPYAGSDARAPPPTAYAQPRDPYANADSYDPYTPSTAYNPAAPARYAPSPPRTAARLPHRPVSPPQAISRRAPSPIRRNVGPPPVPRNNQSAETADLSLLTAPTTATIAGYTTAVFTLPPSHLPVDKYIAVNADDCVDIHRALCRKSSSVWYADGSTRAGEGWASAVEWIIERGQSGRKMRGSVPSPDALDVELAAICKAVEGFFELLKISIKDSSPMSHELIIFCDSAAAIVAIDTSSRPESIQFERLWRIVCSEFLRAHITLVWLPKNSGIEGHILADKIAMVAASNSYLKRKKDGSLPDVYRRPGGGDPAPGGSTEAGPWQRGDADPGRRKSPFERPKPLPLPIPTTPMDDVKPALGLDGMGQGQGSGEPGQGQRLLQHGEPLQTEQDQNVPPPREAVFVTNFPDSLSAKDIGVLYAQFGDLVSVDIYHTDPRHPRFAYVQYQTIDSGDEAINTLHQRPIDFSSAYNVENAEDLAGWAGWDGAMTVVRNEGGRFIPTDVETSFPGVAAWMIGGEKLQAQGQEVQGQNGAKDGGDGEGAREEEVIEAESRKRDRERVEGGEQGNGEQVPATAHEHSPSPHKRAKQDSAEEHGVVENGNDRDANDKNVIEDSKNDKAEFERQLAELIPNEQDVKMEENQQSTATSVPAPEMAKSATSDTRQTTPSQIALPNGAGLARPVDLPMTPETASRPSVPVAVQYPLPARPSITEIPTPVSANLPPIPALAASASAPASAPASQAPAQTQASISTPLVPSFPPASATPEAAHRSSLVPPNTATPTSASNPTPTKPALTNSAAEPQEYPIKVSNHTLRAQLSLVQRSFPKHDRNNWIAHSCLIAVDLDQARRALQADLYATDEGFINGRALEQELLARGFTAARVDAFVPKVLKVLDGIAAAENLDMGDDDAVNGGGGSGKKQDTTESERMLEEELSKYPEQTKEAIRSAGRLLEYLHRGKELQEKKRLDVERRVKVLEGMVKIGEVVGGVVRFLLTDGSG